MYRQVARSWRHPNRVGLIDCHRYASTTATIQHLLAIEKDKIVADAEYEVDGWVRTARLQKSYSFLSVNDGSSAQNLQVVWKSADPVVNPSQDVTKLTAGSSVKVTGKLVPSPKPAQPVELQATGVKVVGTCNADSYPLQKKAHSAEFMRDMVHLRARTASNAAMLRIRSALAKGIHNFFENEGFQWISTPILTANDCEGAGELFQVSTRVQPGSISPSAPKNPFNDFFGKPVYLTVSGQLHLEAFATALSKVYTFGPTFRAENSNTPRHLAEFWMLEPEMAPGTMDDAIGLAERCVKTSMRYMMDRRQSDVQVFADKDTAVLERITKTTDVTSFARMTYTEAVKTLQSSNEKFSVPVVWGEGLASEHEKYLAEKHCKGPVFVTDYPAAIKPFYMKRNPADGGATVQAFDLLVPTIGEMVGGSAREDDFDLLANAMTKLGLLSPAMASAIASGHDAAMKADPADCNNQYLDWYLDLRRFGTVPHAGWGLGFERLVQYCTGLDNIRDAIPVPRVPSSCRL